MFAGVIIKHKGRKKCNNVPEIPQGMSAEEDGLELSGLILLEFTVMHAAQPTASIGVTLHYIWGNNNIKKKKESTASTKDN